MFNYLFTSLLVATFAQAMTVTAPAEGVNWQSGTASQTVSWQAVDTDATSFMIQLVNQAGFLPNSPYSLVANQSTGSASTVNSATVTYNGAWPTGTEFQINLVSASNAILAQSKMFNITAGGSAVASTSGSAAGSSAASSTSSAVVPTTMSNSAMTATTTTGGTTSAAAGDASGGIPNAATSTAASSASSLRGTSSSLVGMVLAAVGALGVFA